jgi:hypothetical protein
MAVIGFSDFPPELIVRILHQLQLKDLLSARLWNRQFDATITESILLQYRLETQIAGVEDNPNCSLTTVERITALRRREMAWSSLEPEFRTTFTLPKHTRSRYDLGDGFYGRSAGDASDNVSSIFNYIRLPTSHSDHPRWKELDLKHEIIDFGMAPTEDLVATVAV